MVPKLDLGRSALGGLVTRLKQKASGSWDDQWTNWDDLGADDPGWGDVGEGPDQPGPDDP